MDDSAVVDEVVVQVLMRMVWMVMLIATRFLM